MAAGRPRTVSLPENKMIELGKEMVKWVKTNQPLHLSEWYSIEKMYTYKQWDTFTQRSEFIPYYEQALSIIKKNYINGTVPPPIAQRFLRIYFKEIKDNEDNLQDITMAKDLKQKKELIDHQLSKDNNKFISPIQDQIDIRHELMMIKAENAELKDKLNAYESKTR
jgi:hypothetical protein